MGVRRFYLEAELAVGRELWVSEAVAAHLVRVLRLRPGAALTLFDGRGGEYSAELLSAGAGGARVRVGAHHAVERESPLALTLLQGISRGERMDQIVQKATELGVRRLIPCLAERSVVQLDAAQGARRLAHWRAIAASACEQCGRNRLPIIEPILPFAAALGAADTAARALLDPASGTSLGALLAGQRGLTLLIGPEGGLSAAESARAVQAGFRACRLGPRTLRTETAPIAALAIAQALAGDL